MDRNCKWSGTNCRSSAYVYPGHCESLLGTEQSSAEYSLLIDDLEHLRSKWFCDPDREYRHQDGHSRGWEIVPEILQFDGWESGECI